MRETTARRSEYLVIDCPYCGKTNYLDVEDDIGEGRIPENGRKVKCTECEKIMLVIPP